MNREQRRKSERIEQRRPNSKKNFVDVGIKEIPIDKLHHDPNLKECDMEVVELIVERFDWADKNLVKNTMSKCIIMTGCNYLDSLCSLRFDITPVDDKVLVRNTMYYVGNYTKMFYAMVTDEDFKPYQMDKTIAEAIDMKYGDIPILAGIYPFEGFPNVEAVDDVYAEFVVKHAQEFSSYLQHTRRSEISEDEEYIFKVLEMVIKKTDELLPEAQVKSDKFVVKM